MEYDIRQINKEPDVEQRKRINDQVTVQLYRLRVYGCSVFSLPRGGA